jgi:hypothetical protein
MISPAVHRHAARLSGGSPEGNRKFLQNPGPRLCDAILVVTLLTAMTEGPLLHRKARWRLDFLAAENSTHPRPAAIREAEECFEKTRAVARAQGAHMLERRATRRETGAAVRRPSR